MKKTMLDSNSIRQDADNEPSGSQSCSKPSGSKPSGSKPSAIEPGDRKPHDVLSELIQDGELELPLLAEKTSRLLSMCKDPDCSTRELAELIRMDQSIASHVLRMANSPMYSCGIRIVSLQQAVARLGLATLREIILIVSCRGRVFDVKGFDVELRESFHHSLATAIFAQEIARMRRLCVEEAFLCGLLHDIGRPVLLQALVDYQRKHGSKWSRLDMLQAVERHRRAVGGKLIRKWGLPDRVADAILDQDPVDALRTTQEAQVLALAIEVARTTLYPENFDPDSLLEHCLIDHLNIYVEQIDELLAKADDVKDLIGRTA